MTSTGDAAERRDPRRPVEETLGFVEPEIAAVLEQMPDVTPGLDDIEATRAFVGPSQPHAASDHRADRVTREDRTVPGDEDAPDVGVRIYRPRGDARPRPGLVWCHGGGFVVGDLDAADRRCADLCASLDAVVVSVDYRLAPEHPFPAAFVDVDAVVRWLAARADEEGVAASRMAVGGASAGATLAAAAALRARDRGGPPLALQVLLQPALDDRCDTPSSHQVLDPRVLHREVQLEMWDHYLGPAGVRGPVSAYAAPARASDLRGLPRAVVVIAEHDPLRDEGLAYALRLRDDGVPTELLHVPGTVHGFDELAPDASVSRRVADHVVAAIAAGL